MKFTFFESIAKFQALPKIQQRGLKTKKNDGGGASLTHPINKKEKRLIPSKREHNASSNYTTEKYYIYIYIHTYSGNSSF